jgi:integral membrane sensor domain MASE1
MKNKLAKISSGVLTSFVALTGFASTAFAQRSAQDWIGGIDGVNQPLESWVITMINWAIGLAALAAVVMLIVAGYLYITANGDENKVEKATKTLTFAIVGLVVCFIAVMLVQFVLRNILS